MQAECLHNLYWCCTGCRASYEFLYDLIQHRKNAHYLWGLPLEITKRCVRCEYTCIVDPVVSQNCDSDATMIYLCHICESLRYNYSFQYAHELKAHMKVCHMIGLPETIHRTCSKCDESFRSARDFFIHKDCWFTEKDNDQILDETQQNVARQINSTVAPLPNQSFQPHIPANGRVGDNLINDDDDTYKCSQCNQKFNDPVQLVNHHEQDCCCACPDVDAPTKTDLYRAVEQSLDKRQLNDELEREMNEMAWAMEESLKLLESQDIVDVNSGLHVNE